jgi:hypothetical protein
MIPYKVFTFFVVLILFIIGQQLFEIHNVFANTKGGHEKFFEVKPGVLSLRPSSERVQLHLNSGEKEAYFDPGTIAITDATGSGLGWYVTVKASPLIEFIQGEKEGRVLPAGSLALSLAEAKVKIGKGSGEPPDWIGGEEYAIDKGTPIALLSAGRDQGMGSYVVSFGPKSLKLVLPEGVKSSPSTYESILTWSIQQGP